MVLSAIISSSCARGSKPNPKPQKPTVAEGAVVKLCIERPLLIRAKEGTCEAGQPGFVWCWVENDQPRDRDLPAVEHQIGPSRCLWREPQNVTVVTIPEYGAVFP